VTPGSPSVPSPGPRPGPGPHPGPQPSPGPRPGPGPGPRPGSGPGPRPGPRPGPGPVAPGPGAHTDPIARLAELGLRLPEVTRALGAYVPAVLSGNQVYVSGQLPMVDGALLATGRVGAEVSVDTAARLAAQCALGAMAAVDALVGLASVVRVVKVVGFVASTGDFTDQPLVVNGASELFHSVFGAAGQHARSAVGVAQLPLGAPVEIETIFECRVPQSTS
jgi:enamine deaminase RidA (YjgF/YER057c/UK114 family)